MRPLMIELTICTMARRIPVISQITIFVICLTATKESLFMFNNIYYRQVDGVSMGSPFGLALVNIFMCSFEGKWLQDCPNDCKPVFYRRDVDETFALFSSPDHADKFKEYVI